MKITFKKPVLIILLILIFLLAIYSGFSSYYRITKYGNDFNVFYLASRNIIEGKADVLYTAHTAKDERYKYLYPPLFAILMIPLCIFPLPVTSVLWFIINLVMYIVSFFIIFQKNFKKEKILLVSVIIGVLTIAYFADNAFQGQVHILILFLITFGWFYYKKDNKLLALLFLSAAALIKMIPGIFFLLLIIKKDYKAIMYYIIWSFALLIILPVLILGGLTTKSLFLDYYNQMIKPIFIVNHDPAIMYNRTAEFKTPHDQDLYAAIKRLFGQNNTLTDEYQFLSLAKLSDKVIKQISQLCYILILIFSIIFCLKYIYSENKINKFLMKSSIISDYYKLKISYTDDLLFALFTILSLLLSPRLRILYLPVLVFPYMILLSISLSDKLSKYNFTIKINYGILVSFVVLSLLAFDLFRLLAFGFVGTFILFMLIIFIMNSINKNNITLISQI